MRLHQLLNSASPRAITAIIALGFASSDYCINLHSAAPRAINGVIALYAVRLAYARIELNFILGRQPLQFTLDLTGTVAVLK